VVAQRSYQFLFKSVSCFKLYDRHTDRMIQQYKETSVLSCCIDSEVHNDYDLYWKNVNISLYIYIYIYHIIYIYIYIYHGICVS
jgi:hypothetical protein